MPFVFKDFKEGKRGVFFLLLFDAFFYFFCLNVWSLFKIHNLTLKAIYYVYYVHIDILCEKNKQTKIMLR
jgi:hypothetical protein